MPKREYCLQEAAAAQELADRAPDAEIRERLLHAVEQWKKLAKSFDETDRKQPFRPHEIEAIKAAISDLQRRKT